MGLLLALLLLKLRKGSFTALEPTCSFLLWETVLKSGASAETSQR